MSEAVAAIVEGKANKQLIETLLRSRLFRDYETVFTKATGLALDTSPEGILATRASRKEKRESVLCAARRESGNARHLSAGARTDDSAHGRHSAYCHLPIWPDGNSRSGKTRGGNNRLLAYRPGFAALTDCGGHQESQPET